MNARTAALSIWILSFVASLGSLFFSQVMKLAPCELCWYQRIALFPIVILLPIALLKNEIEMFGKYLTALVLAGTAFATYHNLLYYEFIPKALSPCREGASCTERHLELFGFVGIPLMSLVTFSLMLVVCILFLCRNRKQ